MAVSWIKLKTVTAKLKNYKSTTAFQFIKIKNFVSKSLGALKLNLSQKKFCAV